ncbi:division/cell wall cluster transcriptional repressor MraZ [Mucilaginibacter pallidiroseus]|uniref:Transcriptional regulator MraZ n=1 Tax=Mucilaginibacter pallidiroseus TaxID=2599295 RepID=A0A563UDE7_9SPHI|nr:division/cell wall cluster transcriptional repressor MraZ [Mucilaginibacter pallidiroseus]TWR29299.1 division/cell wall cluster transcriptional repressor MraZ [Mucilaginibacter pallidiroseus]
MSYLTGEFECKLDAKGRMMIPAGLKKQLPEADNEGLVINRGLEKYLVIYTKKEWDKKLDELSKLNEYDRNSIKFVRYFTAGATNLQPDTAGRVNLPKNLLDYAGITGDVVLTCMLNKIEVWDKAAHQEMINNEPENFAELAELVMGNKGRGRDE